MSCSSCQLLCIYPSLRSVIARSFLATIHAQLIPSCLRDMLLATRPASHPLLTHQPQAPDKDNQSLHREDYSQRHHRSNHTCNGIRHTSTRAAIRVRRPRTRSRSRVSSANPSRVSTSMAPIRLIPNGKLTHAASEIIPRNYGTLLPKEWVRHRLTLIRRRPIMEQEPHAYITRGRERLRRSICHKLECHARGVIRDTVEIRVCL